MYCSQYQLRRQGQDYEDIKPLPCRSWRCEHCAPGRRAQLMAIAASGRPTSCLTLTVNTDTGSNPQQRYTMLHNAWKILVKRIIRQYKQAACNRWLLNTEEGYEYQEIKSYRMTRRVLPKTIKTLNYMAFIEETQKGEPHLHIMLRSGYIPQRWLSQQMNELLQSPIVWIERVKGAKRAIAYVCKYVTKAPAQFGKGRRYWVSRKYRVIGRENPTAPIMSRTNSQLVVQQFTELLTEIRRRGLFVIPVPGPILRVMPMKTAWAKYRDGHEWKFCPEVFAAQTWHAQQSGHFMPATAGA